MFVSCNPTLTNFYSKEICTFIFFSAFPISNTHQTYMKHTFWKKEKKILNLFCLPTYLPYFFHTQVMICSVLKPLIPSPLDPQTGSKPGCYINLCNCEWLSMVLLQLEDPLEAFLKRGEAVESDEKNNSLPPSITCHSPALTCLDSDSSSSPILEL